MGYELTISAQLIVSISMPAMRRIAAFELSVTNKDVSIFNERAMERLEDLEDETVTFYANYNGYVIRTDFSCPASLKLKQEARVMTLVNDTINKTYQTAP